MWKFSLQVNNEEEAIERLGELYDPGSPFCIYEEGQEIPDKKFLIVLGKKHLEIPNILFYLSSISDLKEEIILTSVLPEKEEIEEINNLEIEEIKEIIETEEEISASSEEEEAEIKEEAIEKIEVKEIEEVKKIIYVDSDELALTIAISFHKKYLDKKILIVSKSLYQNYGEWLDENLCILPFDEKSDLTIIVKKEMKVDPDLKKMEGQEYISWERVVEIASRFIS